MDPQPSAPMAERQRCACHPPRWHGRRWYKTPKNPVKIHLRSRARPQDDSWRDQCTPVATDDHWFDGDYFRLRSVAATIPIGFALPDRIREALLTVTLLNAFT